VTTVLVWILFNAFVLAGLAVDIGLLQRRNQTLSMQQAFLRTGLWILVAAIFSALLYATQGQVAALDFSAAYLIELSLSADNLFIFLLIFRYFRLSEHQQYRVLFWGILGAIVLRAALIFSGVRLIGRFHWLIYLLGAFLTYSGLRLLFGREAKPDPEKNPGLRLARRVIPIARDYEGSKFFLRRDRLYATPLLLVLIAVETTDVLFAVDSIPAVLSITLNSFVVYTSNVLAIVGLRSLFFALSSLMEVFEYLHYGISCILVFAGLKMLVSHYYHVPTGFALAVVGGILLLTIVASILHPDKTRSPQR
jgi:TerC family integral membrane protein